ncbi:MAG: hypothetical protein WD273_02665 [Trueperaceae bacterium]
MPGWSGGLISYGEVALAQALKLADFTASEIANAIQDLLGLGFGTIADADAPFRDR